MAVPKKRAKRRVRVRVRQSVSLVHKNDATRVASTDTIGIGKAPTRTILQTNGITFKVKMRKK